MQTHFFSTFRTLLIGVMLFLVNQIAVAQENDALRKVFLQAEKQVWQHDSQQYKSLYNQLHYYPLQPYLDQKRLINDLSLENTAEIESFLTRYENSPLDWPLREKWLNYLAKRKRKALFLKFYKANSNAKLNCTNLLFQLDAGASESLIMSQVPKWWVVGKSQDKTCDPLFKKWIDKGNLTGDLVWQRLALSADGGKHTLIPYLTGLLPESEQYLGRLWHAVRRDPAYILQVSKFPNKNEKEVQILTYGLKRLIWRAPENALSSYKKLTQDYPFTPEQLGEITAKFAIALSSKNHKDAITWIDRVDEPYFSDTLIQWRLAEVLKSQNWSLIHTNLNTMPDRVKKQSQWQYWYGLSLLETNKADLGKQVLTELAGTRHYYGFLAASRLGLPINLQDNPLTFTDQEKQALLTNPAAKRAFEFFYMKRYHHARKEWNYWLEQLPKHEKLMAAAIAYENQWFDRPIFTLAAQGYLDDVSLRFPLAYAEAFSTYSKKANIDETWAMAISRRESSFMSDAHSGAGARGLMQIMPNTAKQLAKRSLSTRYLYKADNNIKLGTKYLGQLLQQYEGNQVLATASYNAGPYRIKKWLAKLDDLPADIWIETIPFKETREYVKSVLAYQQIYQHQRKSEYTSPFLQLIDMQIKQ